MRDIHQQKAMIGSLRGPNLSRQKAHTTRSITTHLIVRALENLSSF